MTAHDSETPIETLEAPWSKEVRLSELAYDGGLRMLRVRIREGRRFTDLELDAATARRLAAAFAGWAERQK